jgi:hypothetical protein
MAQRESEQMSIEVPMHKRMAMGQQLDGTKLEGKGVREESSRKSEPKQSSLSSLKKK